MLALNLLNSLGKSWTWDPVASALDIDEITNQEALMTIKFTQQVVANL